ncbi:MAG: VacB/RNase II family 3'-5' exoribonuclease [Clostridia bacterium]|nr:VacB/RNase II family 3'-5' exoribonuclease [Clostridia bacterium]
MKKSAKRNTARKNLEKYTSRAAQKRRGKARLQHELSLIAEQMGVSVEGAHLGEAVSRGKEREGTERHVRGVYMGTAQGYGFVRCPDFSEDIFIPRGRSMGAIDGDEVEAAFHEYSGYLGERKTEGRVLKIINEGRHTLVGVLSHGERARHGRETVFIPDDPHISIRPRITDTAGAKIGEKVLVSIKRGGQSGLPTASVVRVFGSPNTREANYGAILAECEIECEFSDEELLAAERSAARPVTAEGREVPSEIIFTIDGEGAKDLDDAVSIRETEDGYLVGVHIADVSYYVGERSSLMRAAFARGTSVYFTDKVVPMLPAALSNGACSLNAGEDKYAVSAMISLDKSGNTVGLCLFPSVIRSRVRGVYSEVNSIFDGTADDGILEKYKEVIPSLYLMREVYGILAERLHRRGYIDMELPEAGIILSPDGTVEDIVKRERGISERIIEQLMLLANEAVARELTDRGLPAVYRIHERPSADKLEGLLPYLRSLGLDASGISSPSASARDFALLLASAEDKGVRAEVSAVMLRAMMKARYSDTRHIHFGLASDCYCHFTSPIRRLADLATHTVIRKTLFEGESPRGTVSLARRAAAAATDGELRALTAERKIENLYKALYMRERIGEVYDAVVSSVGAFGVFATLENTCEGLIPAERLSPLATFDERTMSVVARGRSLRLGDRIEIKVDDVDISRGRVYFSLL